MKNFLVISVMFASISANAVSGPAYQNLAKMNTIVQAVVKYDGESDDLVQESEELEVTRIRLEDGLKFEIVTLNQYCTGDINVEVKQNGMGSNPEYKVAKLTCEALGGGQKAVQWSLIQSKILKRANTGKVTSSVEVNQTNRRLKFK